jgi:transcriptional regulator with XRE-family HTH domain
LQAHNISGLTFSQRLRVLMDDRNITQVIMAREVGVSQGAVSGWLNGALPKMDKLLKIARTLGVKPEDIISVESLRGAVQAADMLASQAGGGADHENAVFNQLMSGARGKLKAAREAKGLSVKEVAKAVGYSLGVYQSIEDGQSGMGEKMARKIAKVLDIDVQELTNGSDHMIDRGPTSGTFGAVPDLRLPPGMTAKYVPLISLAQCGPDMVWTDDGYAGEGVIAFNCADPKAFAVKLSGDSMQPKYDAGDTAIIYPSRLPSNGDVVLARLDDAHGGDVMVKLYQSSAGNVTLSSYNPTYQPMSWPRSAFAILYPVAQITKNLI